jgi:TonB family protein
MDGAGSAASIEDMGTRGVVGKAGKGSRGKREARVVARVSSAALQEFDSDSRSQNDIKKVIRRRLGGIKHCYEKRLKRNPDLKGKIVVRFVIHPGGKVIEVEVVENTTGDRELGRCIASRVRSVRFPPAEGGETSVVYPFILAPGG